MPKSAFSKYKTNTKFQLMRLNWSGKDCLEYLNNNMEYIRGQFENKVPATEAARIIEESRLRDAE